MEANVKKMEAQNFLGDAFNMLQELNKVNGRDLSKKEKEAILEKLDEFSTAFIYFRESYDESQSNIHKMGQSIEDIRQIVAVGEKQYLSCENQPVQANQILINMISQIMDELQNIDNWTKDALVEETQSRQLNTIKDIFVETKKDIDGAEKVFRDVQDKIEEQSNSLKDNMESVQTSLSSFSSNLVETKNQLSCFEQIGKNILTGFDEWKLSSGKDLENSFKSQVETVNKKFGEYLEGIDKKTNEVNIKMEKLADKSDSLLSGEGAKQFLVYGGTVLTGLNFILLIIMMFFGK